uniref:RecA family profile 2 domain-containing protein n=1 Tax=Fagus sylvatica TaxID=28930 RepID=A0A2N9G6B0_FAGSY
MDPSLAESMGVNTENVLISCPISAENLPSFVNSLTRTATVDVIMVDIVAALGLQCELDHMIGVICQDVLIKPKTGQGFRHMDEVTYGGNALKFYAVLQLRIIKNRTAQD